MKRHPLSSILIVAVIAFLTGAAAAKDLGVRGAVWPVEEPDLLTEIEKKLKAMEVSGELAHLRREAVETARKQIEAPPRVGGIKPASERRSRLFDPSVRIQHDARTGDGHLIAARGMWVNPLDRHPLTRDLLFIDGTRPVEVDWAIARRKPSVIVLLAGRPLELMRAHGRKFYFDQGGRLARRFGVRATPSLIETEGAFLRITEIPLEDEKQPKSKGNLP